MTEPAAADSSPEAESATPWTVHHSDARDVEAFLAQFAMAEDLGGEPFLQTTITSPPYATLVDYGSDNQIGHGQSYEEYLESCKTVFRGVFEWTRDSGSMWVVADSLMQRQPSGLPSRLVPLPFELATQAAAVGWILREVIIWRKDRTRPWSHRGKLRNGFEYVLLFVKSKDFKFNVDSLRETSTLKSWWVKYPERHNPWGMTPDNVWEIPIPVQGSWDDTAFRHACPFPPELVRRMVALSSDEGDIVFDPFAGSGSVVSGALAEGRRGLGLELNENYVELFRKVAPSVGGRAPEPSSVGAMTERLLELRMLKYPKDLANQLVRAGITTSQVRAVLMRVKSMNFEPARTGYGDIECCVVVADDLSEIERARISKVIVDASGKAPLSKYGLNAESTVISVDEAVSRLAGERVALYTRGRTWYAEKTLEPSAFESWINGIGPSTVVPIVSPLYVRQVLEESN